MAYARSPAMAEAEEIIAGRHMATPDRYLGLAEELKLEKELGLARQLLQHGCESQSVRKTDEQFVDMVCQRAVLTYKDPGYPIDGALDEAESLLVALTGGFAPAVTTHQETLGILGAIWKRRYERSKKLQDLQRSAEYYLRMDVEAATKDQGYTAINGAFVLDLMASREEADARVRGASPPSEAVDRRGKATSLRGRLVEILAVPKMESTDINSYWRLATLAEAHFGLQAYSEAEPLLHRIRSFPVADVNKETTARQLARLAAIATDRGAGESPWEALRALAGDNVQALKTSMRGKVGLALSGGGFRASLFHIGVLAQLAERDLLRHVECLSCVSGGSIIGTQYYLELRNALRKPNAGETIPDDAIRANDAGFLTREDYISIVKKIEKDFLEGVQTNIRCQVMAELSTSLKMMFISDYSRTLRVGELYEENLFSKVRDEFAGKERWLEDLVFVPLGVRGNNFNPKTDNWERSSKVPILVLNATTLNTGRNWQFTATWMGEPPPAGKPDTLINANERLRRLYHTQIPNGALPPHIRLGHAVAASTCVPGLFEPVPLENLFPERVVRLVDGGVHDNQGIASLLDQDCTILIVSDASGQLESLAAPDDGPFSVPKRANDILQARVREAQHAELEARLRAETLHAVVFLHLKKDLEATPVNWIDCKDPTTFPSRPAQTSYGINHLLQRRLANIRTDLDSFADMEAWSLMLSGYQMAAHALPEEALAEIPLAPQGLRTEWRWDLIRPKLVTDLPSTALMHQLEVGSRLMFKAWHLSKALKYLALGTTWWLSILLACNWDSVLNYRIYQGRGLAVSDILLPILVVSAAKIVLLVSSCFSYRKTLRQFAAGFVMLLSALPMRLHLHVIDPFFYLRVGKAPKR